MKRILFLILLSLFIAKAQVPLYEIDNLNVRADLDEKGNVMIKEEFELSFPSREFFWQIEKGASSLKVEADHFKIQRKKDHLLISASKKEGGKKWTLSYKVKKAVSPKTSFDQLHLPIVSEPEVFIENLKITLSFPFESKAEPRVYAIHGVENFKAYAKEGEIICEGRGLSPYSSYIISVNFPKNLFKFPLLSRFSFFLKAQGLWFWLISGLGLPFLTFLAFLILILRRRRGFLKTPSLSISEPPSSLKPALLGVLIRKRAGEREIISTLLDLAQRGFLDIVSKKTEYVLGKRRGKGPLSPFEEFLLSKIFVEKGERKIKRTEFELEKRAAEQLYSPKISRFLAGLYEELAKEGYFIENPRLVSLRFRVFGILFFLLAIFSTILFAFFVQEKPYVLIGPFGQIILALIIIKMAPFLPVWTKKGKGVLERWLAFSNYLKEKEPLGIIEAEKGLLFKYLPYATALGCEIEWAERFSKAPFTPPDWFVSEEPPTLENFVASLFYVTNSLSQLLYRLREPTLA